MELKRFEMAYWPVEKLIKYEQNTKTHPDTQIEKIARSIENYGFDQPISVDMSGVIIKGHGRLMAARLLRLDVVPVIIRDDLTIIEAAASRIADNRVAESPWDENLLPLELEMLKENGIDFEDTGFDNDEIEAILKKNNFQPSDEEAQGKLDKKELKSCPACGHEF